MNQVYLSLGSNEGNRVLWMQRALQLLTASCGIITAQSGIYETAAWGLTEQANFLNQVALLQTDLSPLALLSEIHKIEIALGRQRTIKWGPRTLDIDILFFNSDIINLPELIVPHPYLHERRFTLLPLAEIAPNFIHPVFGKTITELLAICPDKLEVKPYKE